MPSKRKRKGATIHLLYSLISTCKAGYSQVTYNHPLGTDVYDNTYDITSPITFLQAPSQSVPAPPTSPTPILEITIILTFIKLIGFAYYKISFKQNQFSATLTMLLKAYANTQNSEILKCL